MAPAHIPVYLSQKPSTKNDIIGRSILFLVWLGLKRKGLWVAFGKPHLVLLGLVTIRFRDVVFVFLSTVSVERARGLIGYYDVCRPILTV